MKEEKKNPGGRPTTLTEEISDAIIKEVRDSLSLNHAAESNEIPRSTVATWMSVGIEDHKNGKDSIFAKFSKGVRKARAQFIQECVNELKCGTKAWQSNAWLMERCCAEDFGKDSELYKQLLEDYKMLMQSLIDQNKGVNHGNRQKVDSESGRQE